MFWLPVTELEIERIIKSLRGKPSAGIDEVPELIVKKSLQFIKKPLLHIFNASLESVGGGGLPVFFKYLKNWCMIG
jgi:hypothetical protein